MSATSRRAARREQQTADLLGVARTLHRGRFESAPDCAPLRLASGHTLQAETKSTKRPPRIVVKALAQALRYAPDAIPLAVIAPYNAEPIACLPLRALAEILGLQAARVEQLALGATP